MLTKQQINALFPRASQAHRDSFATKVAAAFKAHGIDRNLFRAHFFLAQIGHESGGLTVQRENMNYTAKRLTVVWPKRFPDEATAAPYAGNAEKLGNFVYASRNGNGNEASGDGYRYRGRGYVQLTGREGYREVGKLAKLDLVGEPDLVISADNALEVALCFWDWKGANAVCDTGDFEAVTKKVNGGKIGWDDRLAWLDKVRRVVLELPSRKGQPPVAAIIALQKALRDQGYVAIGAADGVAGRRTMAAITDWRARKGLGPGGMDDLLFNSLGLDWVAA
jgi:putative chitinase